MKIYFLCIAVCFLFTSCHSRSNNKQDIQYGDNHIPKSSVVIYFSKTDQLELSICEAEKRNDTILLKITDSSSRYLLTVLKAKEKTSVTLEELYGIRDSSYKTTIFTPIDQSIRLEQNPDDIRTDFNGFLKMKVAAHYRWDEEQTDTINVSGIFYANVK